MWLCHPWRDQRFWPFLTPSPFQPFIWAVMSRSSAAIHINNMFNRHLRTASADISIIVWVVTRSDWCVLCLDQLCFCLNQLSIRFSVSECWSVVSRWLQLAEMAPQRTSYICTNEWILHGFGVFPSPAADINVNRICCSLPEVLLKRIPLDSLIAERWTCVCHWSHAGLYFWERSWRLILRRSLHVKVTRMRHTS